MAGSFFLVFLAALVAEVYLLIWVWSLAGFWPAAGWLVAMALFGLALLRRQGRRALGIEAPARSAAGASSFNGILVIAAGLLLIIPGFISDAAAFLLLIPSLRRALGRRFHARMARALAAGNVWRTARGGMVFTTARWSAERRPAGSASAPGEGVAARRGGAAEQPIDVPFTVHAPGARDLPPGEKRE
ncbi:MAG: FxsA family protein [Planctomycetes bacterium]|nr:FxsA family protein [Planctomycetota bacterium]